MSGVGTIARYDLGAESPTNPFAPDEEEQTNLLEGIAEHRLTGVAVRMWEEGALLLHGAHGAQLTARHDAVMAQSLRVEVTLVRVADELAEANLPFRVLKGSALAHTVAHRPADREFRDVDLLVPAARIDDAVALVERMGGRRLLPELRPGFDRRFGKSVTMQLDGVEVDLHRTLAPGPFGVWIRPGDLFVLADWFELAGGAMPTLEPTDQLVHACLHAALGQRDPALTNLRDITLLARRDDWDDQRFDEVVQRWQCRPAVARAVELVARSLDVAVPTLDRYEAEPGDADLLEPYLVETDRFASLAAATLRVLPMSERIAYAAAIGFGAGKQPTEQVRSLLSRIIPR